MVEDGPVAAFAPGKGADERADAAAEVDDDGEDGAKLNDDVVHLPVGVLEDVGIVEEPGLDDAQVGGGADGEELGEPLDDAEEDGEEIWVVGEVHQWGLYRQLAGDKQGDRILRSLRAAPTPGIGIGLR